MVTLPEHYTKHSFVSERHKLIYISTPKAGCTTIKWWFADLVEVSHSILNDVRSQESDLDLKVHDVFPIIAPDIANLSNSNLSSLFENPGYFSFALVRNPYSRIFSAWQSKLLLREPLQYGPYKDLDFMNIPLLTRGDIAKGFELFLEHLNTKEAPSFLDIHWGSQFLHLRPDLLPNLHIFHLENTEQLRSRLRDHLNANYVDPFRSRSRNDSLIPYSRSFLTERSAHLIRELYKNDFEQFGYGEAPPAGSVNISDAELNIALKAIHMLRSRHQRIAEIRDHSIYSIAERDAQIAELNRAAAKQNFDFVDRRRVERERDSLIETVKEMRASTSWKITRPLRFLKTSVSNMGISMGRFGPRLVAISTELVVRLIPGARGRIYSVLRRAYRLLPIKAEQKRIWAEAVIGGSPFLKGLSIDVESGEIARLVSVEQNLLFRGKTACGFTASQRRAMVIEHRIPTPDKTSGSVRLAAMCKLIREEGWDVVFISDVERTGYGWVLEDVERDLPKYENALSNMGISYFYGVYAAKSVLEHEGSSFDLVILSYPEMMHKYAPLIKAYAPLAHIAYDTVDLHGLRFSREAEIKKDPDIAEKANFYEKIERAGLGVADTVIAITPDESQQIIARCALADPIIVPNIHSLGDVINLYEEREGLLFIGHYLHSPNEDAVCHFVQDIYPLIEERANDIEFTMIGSSITDKVRRLAQKTIHPVGYVEDPVPYFAKARVFVAPLRYGAGMKGKIGQALSLGLPIVTTSIGAEGMGLENEREVLVADNPRAFAMAVLRLYHDKDLWNRLSSAGRKHILTNFSESAVKPAISVLLKRATKVREFA